AERRYGKPMQRSGWLPEGNPTGGPALCCGVGPSSARALIQTASGTLHVALFVKALEIWLFLVFQ
ncbi:MAG: hypothetical protein ACE5DY_09570, partial [Mariprofundaceae bacterium]